jgi:thiol-disulfide isomerase/thioredoxin
MKRLRSLFFLTLVLIPLVATPAAGPDGWEVLSRPATAFEVEDVEGRPLRSEELAGRIVVIDFWATWCAPCLRELPELVEYHHRLEGREDVALLSFNVTDERADLEAFLSERRVPFRVFLGDDLIGPYELVSFPTKLIIDMRGGDPGVVRFRREGYTPVASIEARVEELLEEAAEPSAPVMQVGRETGRRVSHSRQNWRP